MNTFHYDNNIENTKYKIMQRKLRVLIRRQDINTILFVERIFWEEMYGQKTSCQSVTEG